MLKKDSARTDEWDFMNISLEPVVQQRTRQVFTGLDSILHGAGGHSSFGSLPEEETTSFKLPHELADSRRSDWPDVDDNLTTAQVFQIYHQVRQTGLPNMLGARRRVPSLLNHDTWRALATGHPDDQLVLDGLEFGFPLQYVGPVIMRHNRTSHPSADKYMDHVRRYIDIETKNKALLGPFTRPPFKQWFNISPIMTRPKAESNKRRIIVDMSFPQGSNINDCVYKNVIFGVQHNHNLPTVQDTIRVIQAKNFRVMLATLDIERAYRNIPSCPLDFPLLGISVDNKYYVDAAMPFGARNSSFYMQKVADFIVRALAIRGIQCHLYLDDMVLELDQHHDCHARFAEVMALYRALGLPISYSKIQPPSTQIIYLGISIDVESRTLTIPLAKINQFIALAKWTMGQETVSRILVQRIVGKINHISRCAHPARLFMARILQALRDAHNQDHVRVDKMRADLHWFCLFLKTYNGVSMMNTGTPGKVISADSCLTGGGATDMTRYYHLVYTDAIASSHHINTLEALNCLVALHTLVSSKDRNSVIELCCDNSATISALAFGGAKDPVLLGICQAVWYLSVKMDIHLVYTHVPGVRMQVADALSRAHISPAEGRRADQLISQHSLRRVIPYKYATNYKNFM